MAEPTTEAPSVETIRKAECSVCGGMRNCHVRGKHSAAGGDENISWNTDWYILECAGCEHIFAQTVATNSEDYEDFYHSDGSSGAEYNETIRYWPALSKRKRPEWMGPSGIDAAEAALDEALLELYCALDNDLHILAAIGIRTAYDIASEKLGIDSNLTFKQKLLALIEQGNIGLLAKDRIETMAEAGSASAHRGWRPTPANLDTMMDILEHFIHEAFVEPARKAKLNAEAAKVAETVPPRPSRRKAKPANLENAGPDVVYLTHGNVPIPPKPTP